MEPLKLTYKISASKLEILCGKVRFLEKKDALTLDPRVCRGSTVTWILEDCNRIWTINIVLHKLSLFICLHSLWFYRLKRPWLKPVEKIEGIKPFHLSSPIMDITEKETNMLTKHPSFTFQAEKSFLSKIPTTVFTAHVLTPQGACKGLWWACPSRAHLSPVRDVDPGWAG